CAGRRAAGRRWSSAADNRARTLPRRVRVAVPGAGKTHGMDHDLGRRVQAWIDDDPDPGDRTELEALLRAGDEAELRDRFATHLAFGTAGLRGRLRAGPNGMNRAVVRRAAAGLARYLGPGRTVAIGYDARHR